jgi:hypothetical protein
MVVFWHFRTHFCTLLSYCLLRTTIIHYLKCVSSGCWHPKHVIRALCWCGTGHYGIILCNIGNNMAFELRELQFRDAFCYLIQRFFYNDAQDSYLCMGVWSCAVNLPFSFLDLWDIVWFVARISCPAGSASYKIYNVISVKFNLIVYASCTDVTSGDSTTK